MTMYTGGRLYDEYSLTSDGDRYIDNFFAEYRYVGGRAEATVAWLWDIRESGDIHGATQHLLNNVGQEAASRIFNWAIEQRYIEKRGRLKEPPAATSTGSMELGIYERKNIGQAGTHHITDEDFI